MVAVALVKFVVVASIATVITIIVILTAIIFFFVVASLAYSCLHLSCMLVFRSACFIVIRLLLFYFFLLPLPVCSFLCILVVYDLILDLVF